MPWACNAWVTRPSRMSMTMRRWNYCQWVQVGLRISMSVKNSLSSSTTCQAPIGTVDATLWLCFNRSVETDAYIALGSNSGDRELNLLRAVAEIGKIRGCRVTG